MKIDFVNVILSLVLIFIGVTILHKTLDTTTIIGIWFLAVGASHHFWKDKKND